MKALIGVVMRYDKEKKKYSVNENIIKAISDNGGEVIGIFPNNSDKQYLFLSCQGFILPGGDDISPLDLEIINYAIKKDIPILGICLGMQAMASLEENNLSNIYTNNHYLPHLDIAHKIKLLDDSLISKITSKKELYVNSRHKEHVTSSGIYDVVGFSSDNIIEAIEYKNNRFNIGVQWHPEDMYEFNNDMAKLFKTFIDYAKNNV